MKSVTGTAYARAGLLGNPSDGYNGRTISLIVKNYSASVQLTESQKLTLIPPSTESNQFDSIEHFTESIQQRGYYGGVRLLKAAIKRFTEFGRVAGYSLDGQPNFSISFNSNIPRQVGMAGSSAIVTAAIRAIAAWYEVSIEPHLLASLTLSAESELGIPAGLQDRVIQAYEGLVYMDFSVPRMKTEHGLNFGQYEELDTKLATHLYIAFATNAGEPTEVLHNDLRKRFNQGDSDVCSAMEQFANLAEKGRHALENRDLAELGSLIDQNFDLRASICQLHSEHRQMVATARACGASAKYCGSGGAIVGTYADEKMFADLRLQLGELGCEVIKPVL